MKSGMIRSLDDLGRIVIPKEIRKALNIKEGDPVEIYVSGGSIVMEKYQILKNLDSLSEVFLQAFFNTCCSDASYAVLSNDNILKSGGIPLSFELPLSDAVKSYIRNQKSYLYEEQEQNPLDLFGDGKFIINALFPIGTDRSPAGAFILFRHDDATNTKEQLACAKMLATILTKLTKEL